MRILNVEPESASLKVCWEDGTHSSYPFFWLRDHARDSVSYDERSQQRELFTAVIEEDIKPTSVSLRENAASVDITWPDSQSVVEYPYRFFLDFKDPINQVGTWKKESWDGQTIVDHDYSLSWQDFNGSNGLFDLMTRITNTGFALLHGCPTNFDTVEQIANSIGYVRHTIFGGKWEFEANEDMADSAYTPKELRPHTDGTYSHDAPGLQLLMCCHYDAVGGHSIMVDGLQIEKIMAQRDPQSLEILKTVPIMGRYAGDGVELIAQRPVFRTDHNGDVLQVSFNNYDRAPFRLEDEQMKAFYRAIRCFDSLANSPDLQWNHVLAPGEMLIFDNWRVMHGRGIFTGKRKMAGCYLNREDVESCARRLGLMT